MVLALHRKMQPSHEEHWIYDGATHTVQKVSCARMYLVSCMTSSIHTCTQH